jgi:hypothetical protein
MPEILGALIGGAGGFTQTTATACAFSWVAGGTTTATCTQCVCYAAAVACGRQLTAEETEAERVRRVEVRRVERAASEKAKVLLFAHLSDDQAQSYEKNLCFEVIGQGGRRRYRIRKGPHRNVEEIDEKGKRIRGLCAYVNHPGGVPDDDTVLAQKLWIEHDEEAFLRVANSF